MLSERYVVLKKKNYENIDNVEFDRLTQIWVPKNILKNWKYPEIIRFVKDDRMFMGNLLHVDIIPHSCIQNSLENILGETRWECLGTFVNVRVNYCCEYCGKRTGLLVIPKWEYNEMTETRILRRVVGVCSACFDATNMSRNLCIGKFEDAIYHLKTVRKFTADQFDKHIKDAFDLLRKRNLVKWNTDISLLNF